jgi:hypothetical protein
MTQQFTAGQPIAWSGFAGEMRGRYRFTHDDGSIAATIGDVYPERVSPEDDNVRPITEKELSARWWDTGRPIDSTGKWIVLVESPAPGRPGEWTAPGDFPAGEDWESATVDTCAAGVRTSVEGDPRSFGLDVNSEGRPATAWRASIWPASQTLLMPYGALFYIRTTAPAARIESVK